jgi:hypothetical protein
MTLVSGDGSGGSAAGQGIHSGRCGWRRRRGWGGWGVASSVAAR